jgi:hypothetical protein
MRFSITGQASPQPIAAEGSIWILYTHVMPKAGIKYPHVSTKPEIPHFTPASHHHFSPLNSIDLVARRILGQMIGTLFAELLRKRPTHIPK